MIARLALALAAPLLLIGCQFVPGKFESGMAVAADGSFDFRYKGEIILAGYERYTHVDAGEEAAEKPLKCGYYDLTGSDSGKLIPDEMLSIEGTENWVEQPCTKEEVAEHESEREAMRNARARGREESARARREQGPMIARLLGVDPNDEKSFGAFADQLRRQDGWKAVTYRGKGVFDVDYAISGRLDRDFVWPMLPQAAGSLFPAVIATRAADGRVRISAPGFGGPGGPGAGVVALMASGPRWRGPLPGFENTMTTDGKFTISTAAPVVSTSASSRNEDARGVNLNWVVKPDSATMPEAVLRLK